MNSSFTRRYFAKAAIAAGAAAVLPALSALSFASDTLTQSASPDPNKGNRIVDTHVHFDEKNPSFVEDLVTVCSHLNLTACVLTPHANRNMVADAAKRHPAEIVPFGFVDLDARDVVKQVKEFRKLGYRGLGEIEFVKKPLTDPAYFAVYELANEYEWIVLFHTGIVLRRKFDEPEDVASYRMRAFHLEEIARRFPRITAIGAHCGNPEYEWAAEVARWNPNVFFDLSGSTLSKFRGRLTEFEKFFWWSGTEWNTKAPENDPSAFSKLVFGSDTNVNQIEDVIGQYRSLFQACGVPEHTQKLIMGGTLGKILNLTT
jgi:predicted TIM-barrel fold metal-dependent hydrolase